MRSRLTMYVFPAVHGWSMAPAQTRARAVRKGRSAFRTPEPFSQRSVRTDLVEEYVY
jgi:hypothetical protein